MLCCVQCRNICRHIIVVCVSLSVLGKKWLRAFGSNAIDKLQFRDSFVMLGQRGLSVPGSAVEQVAFISSANIITFTQNSVLNYGCPVSNS